MRQPRLALVYPRFRYPSGDMPLGIATLAAWIRRELPMRVSLHDATFQPGLAAFVSFLDRAQPTVVGIGASTLMLDDALQLARIAASRGARVVLGGPHPSLHAEQLLRQHGSVHAVVRGEAERSLQALLERWSPGQGGTHDLPPAGVTWRDPDGAVRSGPPAPMLDDLDELPHPAWDLLPLRAYLSSWGKLDHLRPGLPGANITAGRGCPYRCSFCQPALKQLFGPQLRLRSPEHLVREMVQLSRRHGAQGFWFTDDTFTARHSWVREFCAAYDASGLGLPWGCTSRADRLDAPLLRRMAASGLARLGIGLESAVERIREEVYDKGISLEQVRTALEQARALGVHSFLFLMLGAPGETVAEMLTTISTAARLPADGASFSLCVPLPGTALHQRLLDQGASLSEDPSHYDYYARQPMRAALPPWALRSLQRYGWARFYLSPQRWRGLLRLAARPAGWRAQAHRLRRIFPRPPRV